MHPTEPQQYLIALSPELGVSAAEFVAAWNASPDCKTAAEAHLAPALATSEQYQWWPDLPPDAIVMLTNLAIGAAGGVAGNVFSNAVYDLIKSALFGRRARVKVIKPQRPDSPPILAVEPEADGQ